jgi:hypothetical protein
MLEERSTYRDSQNFNGSIYCFTNFCFTRYELRTSIKVFCMSSEISVGSNLQIQHTDIKRGEEGRKRYRSYLTKRTTKTSKATVSPTIPMKVATPFKRTCKQSLTVNMMLII